MNINSLKLSAIALTTLLLTSTAYAQTEQEKQLILDLKERFTKQYEGAGVSHFDLHPVPEKRSTVKSIIEKSKNGIAIRSYSYYLDKAGAKIYHGPYSLTYSSTNSAVQGNLIVKGNFIDGKLHGLFKYHNSIKYYTKILGRWILDNGRDFSQNKPPIDITINCHYGFMTGTINFSYERYHRYKGDATNGVLNPNSTFTIVEDYRGVNSTRDTIVLINDINKRQNPDQQYLAVSSFDDRRQFRIVDGQLYFTSLTNPNYERWLTHSGVINFHCYIGGFEDYIEVRLPVYPVRRLAERLKELDNENQ